MSPKRKLKLEAPDQPAIKDWNYQLKNFISLCVSLKQSDSRMNMDEKQQLELFWIFLHMAEQPGTQLAASLAAPAVAIIPIIEDILQKTEIAMRSKNLNEEQRRRAETLSDQLDYALALIHQDLCGLIRFRGRFTRNIDLFCAALGVARGDSCDEARLIRRSVYQFPRETEIGTENIVEMSAWETYQRVAVLDDLVDEFPGQIAQAALEMHGWPMLRHRHGDNRARCEYLAERFNLGAEYPLDASKQARFHPGTPMVRFLDALVYQMHHIRRMTQNKKCPTIEAENKALLSYLWEFSDEVAGEELLAVWRAIRKLPPLIKSTVPDWAKKGIVPHILATDARDYVNCKEPALKAIARQKGVKSLATFRSRLLAAVIPTLKGMSRPG